MGRLHEGYHVIAFFVTGYLLAWTARTWRLRVAMLLLTVAFAFLTEWLESVIWHNGFEWHDIYSDLIGVSLSLIAILISARSATRRVRSLQPTLL